MAGHQPQEIVVDAVTVLRPRSLANEAVIYRFIDTERAYLGAWVKWVPDYTRARLHQDIVETLQETKDGTLYIFDIFYNGEFVGAVDAHEVVSGKSAELGYYIGEAFTSKGIATKCTQWLIAFLTEHAHIQRFFLEISEGNRASERVAEKLGFSYVKERFDGEYGIMERLYQWDRP